MHDTRFLTGDELAQNARPVNPFSSDLRHFKTIFDIRDSEGMMDFGNWVHARCDERRSISCGAADLMVELFYEMMRRGMRGGTLVIVVEESFEELFVTMTYASPVAPGPRAEELGAQLGSRCLIRGNTVCVRLDISGESMAADKEAPVAPVREESLPAGTEKSILTEEVTIEKEVRIVETAEKKLLRQSFVDKTTAVAYVREIGGDVLDEVRDLESLDAEWSEKLHMLEADPSVENVRSFADGVLGIYVRVINNLFEFTALAYALSSLGAFLKENGDAIISDPKKLRTLVMLMEHLGEDLSSWREHIFSLQDTADIHYLDSSFFSSCMQIEGIITDKEVATDDDNDFEFF